MSELDSKYTRLKSRLSRLEKIAIAFSGGVDSTFLLAVAKNILGDNFLALTVDTPYMPEWEINEAADFTSQLDVRHAVVKIPIPEIISSNPPDRCYQCKKIVFTLLLERARQEGFIHLADGTNSDDSQLYRPGLRALEELHIISPLKEAGLGKQDIRDLSHSLNLPTWDKPPYSCLLTRIPHNTPVCIDELRRIEKAELLLHDLGFSLVRVRSHGSLARIEVEPTCRAALLDESISVRVHQGLRALGYSFVTLDLLGYQTGSLDQPNSTPFPESIL